MADGAQRYGIDELADFGGVSRRTVRYYVQEGLIPAPYGVGRGDHYGAVHLEALLRVRSLQEQGRTLDEIRQPPSQRAATAAASPRLPPVAAWRRLTLAPGVELHVSDDHRLPNAAGLQSLAEWCRAHLAREDEDRNANE